MTSSNETMRQAMRLMQAGDLHAATRTLQHALAGSGGAAPASSSQDGRHDTRAPGTTIEGEFRVVEGGEASSAAAAADAVRAPAPRDVIDAFTARGRASSSSPPPWLQAAPGNIDTRAGVMHAARQGRRGEGGVSDLPMRRFGCDAGELQYGLHIPAGIEPAGAPLLLMLHGCTQTPADFARGTRMNQLADEHGYVVAWPAQSAERNQNRCWNWFRGSDQRRGQGEPAMLAALTRHLLETHRLDADRVYVAGLSAGGAMAAVLANTHPDVYAAIGVHSGLPIGLASDVPSAFAAMRKGGGGRRPSATGAAPVPAIVFHGDKDATVHPGNGLGVIEQSLGSGNGPGGAATTSTVEHDTAPGGRSATRTVHRTADGRVAAEHWTIHGSGHAWSGGDAAGSYTDPQGPDASAQMLRFFDGCRRAADRGSR